MKNHCSFPSCAYSTARFSLVYQTALSLIILEASLPYTRGCTERFSVGEDSLRDCLYANCFTRIFRYRLTGITWFLLGLNILIWFLLNVLHMTIGLFVMKYWKHNTSCMSELIWNTIYCLTFLFLSGVEFKRHSSSFRLRWRQFSICIV